MFLWNHVPLQAFLERIYQDYGELDLEWLRNMPSDQTKDFLLSIHGLGLKSVECIRLLTLHHLAFPVRATSPCKISHDSHRTVISWWLIVPGRETFMQRVTKLAPLCGRWIQMWAVSA